MICRCIRPSTLPHKDAISHWHRCISTRVGPGSYLTAPLNHCVLKPSLESDIVDPATLNSILLLYYLIVMRENRAQTQCRNASQVNYRV